ncbi:MAG: hypothetical protein WBP64_11105 [Nitrososphaeraceae archaeon]
MVLEGRPRNLTYSITMPYLFFIAILLKASVIEVLSAKYLNFFVVLVRVSVTETAG